MAKKSRNFSRALYFLILVLFIGTFVYDNLRTLGKAKDGFTISNYLSSPEKYDGYKMEVMGRIVKISQEHFVFNIGSMDLNILGSGIQKPVLGETALYVNFRGDGTIEMIDYHNYNYNHVLYIISLIAIILFLTIFFKEWKITSGGFKNA